MAGRRRRRVKTFLRMEERGSDHLSKRKGTGAWADATISAGGWEEGLPADPPTHPTGIHLRLL
ncbi:hypothetical protein [Candidatus Methanocrinis natronophilus]|uniref:Uncharacterized protein n=1 Tax=Candidatus Methanocrinis natronophilus TaxID=3033396 RepID=A0ABT5X9M8_9EURY|nr:hypothetical protein [Candidatus Methanocrinis natronophilus]MDF0591381.1 hypothetical protein [Candidatus Methanocrinis natronophilus]